MTAPNANILYYNFVIDNSLGTTTIPATKTEIRTSPLLSHPEDWACTIVRAVIPMEAVSLFLFDDNHTAPYATPGDYSWTSYNKSTYVSAYAITLTYDIIGSPTYKQTTVYVPWIPDSTNTNNRRIFKIEHFIKMVNIAFFTAYSGLFAPTGPFTVGPAIPAAPGSEWGAPYLEFNPVTQLFSLVAAKNRFSEDEPAVTRINIWFNTKLYSLFDKFDDFFNTDPTEQFRNVQILVYNSFDNNTFGSRTTQTAPPTTFNSYIMTQEVQNLFAFRDWIGIVFTSATLPIIYEQQLGNFGTSATQGSGSASFPFILDVVINSDVTSTTTQVYLANPQRWIDMVGGNSLQNIDISVFIQDKDGSLFPLHIPAGRTLTIKLGFKKRPELVV